MRIPDVAPQEQEPDPEPEPQAEEALPSIQTAPKQPRSGKHDTPKAAAKPTKKFKRDRGKKGWFDVTTGDSASTDVSLMLSAIIGFVLTIVWYGAMFGLRAAEIQFAELFCDRGPIPYPTTFLMFWALAILFLKWLNLKQQKDAMLLDVLPTEVSPEISMESLDGFIDHINELPGASNRTFMVNRVIRGIEHFRVRKSAAETVTMMELQSGIDANNVAGSFTILKVLIWALPILGFIGTVMGVSSAVGDLGAGMSDGGIDGMQAALERVFAGLGVAFDTTLLALIMSLFVKIPASAIQKSEEDLIMAVDEYCNESLLRRLNDGREGGAIRGLGSDNGDTAVFREAVEQALGTQHAEMERWLTKLDAIGGRLTTQVAQGWDEVNNRIEGQQKQHVKVLHSQQLDQQARLQAQLDQMANAADKIQATLTNLANQAANMQTEVNGAFANANTALAENFQGMSRGLQNLSGVLESLGEQQVVVQQVAAPADPSAQKSGWFGKKSRGGKR